MLRNPTNCSLALVMAVLLVALAVLPAQAAVQGTEGGTQQTQVNRSSVYTNRTVSSSTEYLAPIIRDRGNRTVQTVTQYNYTGTTYHPVNGRCAGYARWNTYTTGPSWYTFLRTTYQEAADNKVGERYTQVGTTFDHTTVTNRTTTGSADLIVVGDSGALADQYVAQGTQTTTIDATDYYWNDLHRTDVRQKTLDKYNDYRFDQIIYYQTHIQYVAYVSPLVLNLDGSGKLQASGGQWQPHQQMHTERLALFDFFGTGEVMMMEWVGPQDGLLCVPKPDGTVDGTCLFGIANGYDNGYEELAATRDRNKDGKVSGAELEGLYVWQDANGNAVAGASELKTVQELGITEISVRHTNYKSTFVRNGQSYAMWDWWPNVKALKRMRPPQGS
ncbi:MAG TPA: hypothetical protein VNO81_09980 [Candidatus Nitrosotenuis sp.]|jgi:hypothetical protein|nr:hypothetical protein [Candidatus Nitrosotenuis sp.]